MNYFYFFMAYKKLYFSNKNELFYLLFRKLLSFITRPTPLPDPAQTKLYFRSCKIGSFDLMGRAINTDFPKVCKLC